MRRSIGEMRMPPPHIPKWIERERGDTLRPSDEITYSRSAGVQDDAVGDAYSSNMVDGWCRPPEDGWRLSGTMRLCDYVGSAPCRARYRNPDSILH